ncbi:MAG: RNA polymerase sigma-70 factor [Steroidobacteraceae bacterium]
MRTRESSQRPEHLSALFERHRPRLFALAYRMLGSRADAEDALQDAYIRWHQAGERNIASEEAWLVTIVTRLCIDRLRTARTEREAYVGPWLPEPLLESASGAEAQAELASSLCTAFLLLMARLAGEERAAFLLHDVFETDYGEISRILTKSATACRQLVSRARKRLRDRRPRIDVNPEAARSLLDRFVHAVHEQDRGALLELFAREAAWTSDGGGKARAARKVIHGRERIARFVVGVLARPRHRLAFLPAIINGEPGLVLTRDGEGFAALSISTDGVQIVDAFVVLNPDKLRFAFDSNALSLVTGGTRQTS